MKSVPSIANEKFPYEIKDVLLIYEKIDINEMLNSSPCPDIQKVRT